MHGDFFNVFTLTTFPVLILLGLGMPVVSPVVTKRMLAIVALLMAVPIIDLWFAILIYAGSDTIGLTTTHRSQVVSVLLSSMFLITYVLLIPVGRWLFELGIYNRTYRDC